MNISIDVHSFSSKAIPHFVLVHAIGVITSTFAQVAAFTKGAQIIRLSFSTL